MCGRFGIDRQAQELEEQFNASFYSDEIRKDYKPTYDVRPTTDVPVVTTSGSKSINLAHWGFKGKVFNPKTQNLVEKLFINARSEGIDEKKNFKGPWQEGQRCIFLMSRFYEWMATSAGKLPFAIQMKSNEPFAVAGIYKQQEIEGATRLVACLITVEANQLLKIVHNQGANKHRMPAILNSENRQAWLDKDLPSEEAKSCIYPFPDEALQSFVVQKSLQQPDNQYFKEQTLLEEASKQYGFDFVEF